MYSEIGEFLRYLAKRKELLRDGELWTALAGGVIVTLWFHRQPNLVEAVQKHFGEFLSVTGIIFGFVLATLIFYIQAISAWDERPAVQRVADKLIDWHVWTVVCLLALIGYTLILWVFGAALDFGPWSRAGEYGGLAFLALYSGFQILNHALTIWWTFRTRHAFVQKK